MTRSGKIMLGAGAIGLAILIFADNSTSSSKPKPQLQEQVVKQKAQTITSIPEPKKIEAQTVPKCHPSYSGACLDPDASDYDCAGGSGNGPYYTGKVRVIGPDVFGLDRDHDGWGCE